MGSNIRHNWSAHSDTQQQVTAARHLLRAGGLQRYINMIMKNSSIGFAAVVLVLSGCSSIPETSLTLEERIRDLQRYSLGYIYGSVEGYYHRNNGYPDSLDAMNNPGLMRIFKDVLPRESIRYQKISETEYMLKYWGPDGEMNTSDDIIMKPTLGKSSI